MTIIEKKKWEKFTILDLYSIFYGGKLLFSAQWLMVKEEKEFFPHIAFSPPLVTGLSMNH